MNSIMQCMEGKVLTISFLNTWGERCCQARKPSNKEGSSKSSSPTNQTHSHVRKKVARELCHREQGEVGEQVPGQARRVHGEAVVDQCDHNPVKIYIEQSVSKNWAAIKVSQTFLFLWPRVCNPGKDGTFKASAPI